LEEVFESSEAKMAAKILIPKLTSIYSGWIFNRHWSIARLPTNWKIYTSDNPIICIPGPGIQESFNAPLHPQNILCIPIDSSNVFMAYDPLRFGPNNGGFTPEFTLNFRIYQLIKQQIFHQAGRFLYTQKKKYMDQVGLQKNGCLLLHVSKN
jgi:hypothetical protein